MKPASLAIILICTATALGLGWERRLNAHLRDELTARQHAAAELSKLTATRDELRRRQLTNEEIDRLRQAADARKASERSFTTPAATPVPAPRQALTPGDWTPAAAWQNRGRATPVAVLETMLWASAGGDLAALKDVLAFDDASQALATKAFANLPESDRQQLATPADLLALIVAGNVPLDSALIVARQQLGDTEVLEYMRLKDRSGVTRQVCLTARRLPDGWRLQVPAETVAVMLGAALPAPTR